MIERLLATLPAVAALDGAELDAAAGRRLVADCADALRLQLDCPQQDLTPAQRASLHRLAELADAADAPGPELRRAAHAACAALGLAPARHGSDSAATSAIPGHPSVL